jgi:hypothetical protein
MKTVFIKWCVLLACYQLLAGCNVLTSYVTYDAVNSNDWQFRKIIDGNSVSTGMEYNHTCVGDRKPFLTESNTVRERGWLGPFILPIIPLNPFTKENTIGLTMYGLGSPQCPQLKVNGKVFKAKKPEFLNDGTVFHGCSYYLTIPLKGATVSFEDKVGQCQLPDIHYKRGKTKYKLSWFWDYNG